MHLKKLFTLLLFILLSMVTTVAYSQQNPTPEGAFMRSLVIPGWGHYYVDQEHWTRGQVHLGAEVVMIASYFGFSVRADNLQNQYETLATLKAGVDISDRGRTFQLALGDYNTLQEYNDFQLRSRNWNRLFEDQPENRWNWDSEESRKNYNNLRSDVDQVRNQLPAILGLMIVNRVISAVSAYNRAKNQNNIPEITLLPISTPSNQMGIVGSMKLRF